ncbi:uncharacterized protein EAE98_008815 [Botrytis deweyae]|uniref:Uncharacterized protein n=1 Tax=Botrytis deweyae TaxID=2478750 RepID=A0ABQ7ID51_9HELO|nr:uncharacterized protein EAE98_008815 [Botrytis deweyae]KAF7920786.1 hypothetical protein EAE98_008815 [Botrytis deweyae]
MPSLFERVGRGDDFSVNDVSNSDPLDLDNPRDVKGTQMGFAEFMTSTVIQRRQSWMRAAEFDHPPFLQRVPGWNTRNYNKIGFEAIHVNSPDYIPGNRNFIPTYIIFPHDAAIPSRADFFKMTEVVVRFIPPARVPSRCSELASLTGRWSETNKILIFRHDLNPLMYTHGPDVRHYKDGEPAIEGLYFWDCASAFARICRRVQNSGSVVYQSSA